MKKYLWLFVVLLTACDDLFKIHPYDVDIDGQTGINATHIATIESRFANKDTMRIAFISDTHGWYSETKDEVADINRRTDIDFVVHCGDLTETGTTKEYLWCRDIIDDLRYPYVALIGNHDFLGTGDQAYNVMFGEMNLSFIAGRVKFVCLNTNATEYDYMAAVPNFDYMEEEFAKDSAIFSLCLLVMQGHAMAQDSLRVAADDSLQLPVEQESRYDRHVNRAKQRWGSLIPRQLVLQNAGNMGLLSAGIGWDYGKRRQWETHLLIGFIPKHQSSRAKMTMTLKQNFIPWTLDLKHGWSLSPLTASLYVNTVYGNEFWRSQPHRYPDKYYEFMSTKLRLNIAIGQRLTFQIPYSKRKHNKSVSLFYEISSCDLYIRSKYMDSSVPLKDILSLSIGLKFQLL